MVKTMSSSEDSDHEDEGGQYDTVTGEHQEAGNFGNLAMIILDERMPAVQKDIPADNDSGETLIVRESIQKLIGRARQELSKAGITKNPDSPPLTYTLYNEKGGIIIQMKREESVKELMDLLTVNDGRYIKLTEVVANRQVNSLGTRVEGGHAP